MNSSGSEMNISDAKSAPYNWISGVLQYWGWDEGAEPPRWDFLPISSTDERKIINSWEGVFVYSYKDNITLIRQN